MIECSAGIIAAMPMAVRLMPSGPYSVPASAIATKAFQRAAPWNTEVKPGASMSSMAWIGLRNSNSSADMVQIAANRAADMRPTGTPVKSAVESVTTIRQGKQT